MSAGSSMPTTADFASLPRNVLIVLAFNAAIALLLTALRVGGFAQNMVYSQCIGLTILFLIDGSRRILWGNRTPSLAGMVLVAVAGIPAGFFIGSELAFLLVGEPYGGGRLYSSGAIVLTTIAGVIGTWYFLNRERLVHLRLDAEKVERGAAEARLKLLQAQIEPHFLFNTLANLHSLIGSDPARAQKMLEHLNDYLRATLGAARRESGTLGEELELLRGYLEVQKIRMASRLSYNLSVPKDLEKFSIPPMLLQPLVENAIKHGLEPKVDGGRVELTALRKNDVVQIEIADSGLGMGGSTTKGMGVGLEHVRERLAAAYGKRASLETADAPGGGVIVTVKIPA
jgi:signal transduction histidine kinase